MKTAYEAGHSISYQIACAPSEDSDQPAHPRSLITVFAGHSVTSQGYKASSGGQPPYRNDTVFTLSIRTDRHDQTV